MKMLGQFEDWRKMCLTTASAVSNDSLITTIYPVNPHFVGKAAQIRFVMELSVKSTKVH